MKKRFPNIYPVFQVVPFQHLYQRLLEEVVDVVPDFFQLRDPNLSYLSIADAQPMSYGVYYKTLAGNPRRRAFVELVKEAFEDAGKEGDPS